MGDGPLRAAVEADTLRSATRKASTFLGKLLYQQLECYSNCDGCKTQQSKQRNRAACRWQLRGLNWRRFLFGRICWKDLNGFSYRFFLFFWCDGFERNRLQVAFRRKNRFRWDDFLAFLSQFAGPLLRVNEFLAEIISRIEPCAQRHWADARAFVKSNH